MSIDPTAQTPVMAALQTIKTSGFHMVAGQNDRMAGSVPVVGRDSFAAKIAANTGESGVAASADTATTDPGGFKDFLDIINPLQHIPLVSTLYQHLTGDTIGPAAEIIGGGLFGGPIGAMAGAASALFHTAMDSTPETATKKPDDFAKVLKSVTTQSNDTTIALADLRQGYSSYNV